MKVKDLNVMRLFLDTCSMIISSLVKFQELRIHFPFRLFCRDWQYEKCQKCDEDIWMSVTKTYTLLIMHYNVRIKLVCETMIISQDERVNYNLPQPTSQFITQNPFQHVVLLLSDLISPTKTFPPLHTIINTACMKFFARAFSHGNEPNIFPI